MRCYEHLNILSKDESLKEKKKRKKRWKKGQNGQFFEKKIIKNDDNN